MLRSRARFGGFEADLASGELFRDGKKVAIQEKPFALLSLLLRAENFLTRDEVFSRLWPDVFVEKDVSINTAVRRLRIALQGESGSPSLVETVGSRGYRLSVRVEWLPDPDEKEPARQPRLAVMPFADLNAQPGDFFTDGLNDEVIAHVAGRLKSIAVIAPRTSGRVKANERTHFRAAHQLHSDFELSGTVSRMNGWMRITARLVRLRDQNCIWTQSYLRPDQDFFAVQEEIAKNISQAIGPMIAPNVGTVPVW